MNDGMDIIINQDSSLECFSHVGGKAFNLYLMQQQGVMVPRWFCLSSRYFELVYQSHKSAIKTLISSLDLNSLESIKRVASEIEGYFLNTDLESDLKQKLNQCLTPNKTYAVRSSAIGEDGEENSYAGQLSTFLYISPEGVIDAIKKCWASIFSARNIQYRLHHEIHTEPQVGVVIQEMIDPEASGVMFTAHPLLGENFLDQIVINAGYGVGEGIVSDQVEVDSFLFSKSQKSLVDSTHKEKTLKMVRADEGGVVLKSVEESKRKSSVLTHSQVSKLAGIGLQLAKYFKCEQDIEWCIDKQGRIYITQTRPITTIRKGINKLEFLFDNSNIVESFPGVNTPWTLGQIRDVYQIAFKRSCLRLGLSKKLVNRNNYLFLSLIGMYQGRLFLNLSNWYAMMRFVPYTESYIKTWEEMLNVRNAPTQGSAPSVIKEIRDFSLALKVFSKVFYYFFSLDWYLTRLDKRMQQLFERFWEGEKNDQSLAFTVTESIHNLEEFKADIFHNSEFTLINDIYAFVFTAFTKKIINRKTKLDGGQVFNELMNGVNGMESIKPLESLNEMAKFVGGHKELLDNLKTLLDLPKFNLDLLPHNSQTREFKQLFEQHLEIYGDRGINELKLETLTYREAPERLLRLLISYVENEAMELHADSERRQKALQQVLKQIQGIHYKWLFKFCLKMATRSITYRENFRLHRSRAYGVLRRMTNNLGKKMHALGDLERARDIYYLEKADLYNHYSGLTFDQDLKSKIRKNKFLYQKYLTLETSSRYKIQQGHFSEVSHTTKTIENQLQGVGCSAGVITGEVIVVDDIDEINRNAELGKDKILVSKMTDPGWVFLMAVAKGLIVEKGSLLSHTAIIGRELGIPTIVGVEGATSLLKTGDNIELNANTGEIRILGEEK